MFPLDWFTDIWPSAPSLGPLSQVLGPKVLIISGIIWLAALIYCVWMLVIGIGRAVSAHRQGYGTSLGQAVVGLALPALGLIILAMIPVLVPAIIA